MMFEPNLWGLCRSPLVKSNRTAAFRLMCCAAGEAETATVYPFPKARAAYFGDDPFESTYPR